MTKRRFLLNKLVRNKSLDNWISQGCVAKTAFLNDNDILLEAITQKMIEEMEEIFSSESQKELIEEIADFEEIFDEFKKLISVKTEEIKQARAAKNAEKGNFSDHLFCDYVDVPTSAENIIKSLEEKSEKYPELDPLTDEFLNNDFAFEDEDMDEEDAE